MIRKAIAFVDRSQDASMSDIFLSRYGHYFHFIFALTGICRKEIVASRLSGIGRADGVADFAGSLSVTWRW